MPTHTAHELLQHLSPPFLLPDDAARHASRQIDRRKKRFTGGYILVDPEGHYRATRPLEGQLEDFLFEGELFMEGAWDRLMPAGYRYVAYYFCDADNPASLQRLRPSWTPQHVALIQSLPVGRVVAACYALVQGVFTLGPQGSLLRFVAHGEQPKARLSLPPEHEPVERYVRDLLDRGTLAVVDTSPVWAGLRGEVPAGWKAFVPVTEPANTDPAFSPLFADASSAMNFAKQRLLLKPTARQLGFLLKHVRHARYVVTEPVTVTEPVFDPHLVFRSADDGTFYLPPDYRFAGLYWLAIDAAAPPSVSEPWLYERFILPRVLAHAINLQRVLEVPGLALYVSTVDGALLRYQFSNSGAESRFYNPPGSSVGIDNGQQAALDEGRLAVRTYIQQLAAAGDLSVVETSPLWDVAGRIDGHWQPYSRHRLAALSQAFVLADDAARYAHERIGSRREREYIGLILKGPQQHFFATEPQENPGPRFDMSRVGPVDRGGVPLVIAAGYSLHGIYTSRAHSPVMLGDTEAEVAAQMFLDSDIHQVLTLAPKVSAAYLSGSADSLIAFEPYAPALSRELFDLSAPERGGSQLHRQLQDHSLVPSDVVRAMVLAGVVRVVVGNRLWGSPARVQSDWSPPYVIAADPVPPQPVLGPIFASARQAVVDACARWRLAYAQAPQGLGVVLKHKASEIYVATQVVPGAVLDRLIFAAEFGAPVLTESFTVHALYYSASGLPKGLRGQAAWVGRHFIGAHDLYAGLFDQQGRRRARPPHTLALYLSPLDGGLLTFDPGYDPLGVLQDESGKMDPDALQARLGQTLTARGYVRQVALGGPLTVINTSTCWDVAGRVGPQWFAFAQTNRHALGPCFATADDAARHAQERLGNRRDRVYGGLILRRTDGLFTATDPVAVYVENFAPGWIRRDDLVVHSQFLGGSTAVARYHSRPGGQLPFALSDGERAVYQNMFATDFLGAMLDDSPSALRFSTGLEYLFCDDGALLSVASNGGALERSLAAKLRVRGTANPKHNELEQSLRDGVLAPSEYVSRVARALVLRVVKGSTLWGQATRVEQWQAAAVFDGVPALSVDVPLGPVFAQLTDALRDLHRQSGQRPQLSYGVVLKARNAEQYLATAPQPVGGLALSLDRLLVGGVPPAGLEVQGLYLCPPAQPEILRDDPLYRCFVSPADLSRAWGLAGPKPSEYLPVFIGCVDGAWLQLRPRLPSVFLGNALSRLKNGSLAPLGYIREIAQAHEVMVLDTSEIWGIKGRVDSNWEPRRNAPQRDKSLAFGPLFSHPDDAARHALAGLGREVPYLGLVLVNTASTSFIALEPLRDTGIDSPLPRRLFRIKGGVFEPSSPAPAYVSGFKLLAVQLLFQRMPGNPDDTPQDQRLAAHFVARDTLGFYRNRLSDDGVRGAFCYVSTRQDGLLKYVPRYTDREENLFSGGLLGPTDYRPTQWLSRLASDGVVQVLDPDDYWTRSGVLKVDWTLEAGEEHSAWEVEPAYPARDEL